MPSGSDIALALSLVVVFCMFSMICCFFILSRPRNKNFREISSSQSRHIIAVRKNDGKDEV